MNNEDLEVSKLDLTSQISGEGSIRELTDTHPELVKSLSRFCRADAVKLISALETFSDLHGRTLRIVALLHLAVVNCNGKKKASSCDLKKWIKFLEQSPLAMLEDPAEDVFIGYICTENGGFRVFQGIFSHCDFIVERLMMVLSKVQREPLLSEVYRSAIDLLRLSEAIACRLDLARYSPVTTQGDNFKLPSHKNLHANADSLEFSFESLKNLGVNPEALTPYIFKDSESASLENMSMFKSDLEKHPLLKNEDVITVASPSSIPIAVIESILSVFSLVKGGRLNEIFKTDSAAFFFKEVIERLNVSGLSGVSFPELEAQNTPFVAHLGQFDFGKPLIAISLCSQFEEAGCEGIHSDSLQHLSTYINEYCEKCEAVQDFTGGLVLVGVSSLGEDMAMLLENLRPNWHIFCSHLADWRTLVREEQFTAQRLWTLSKQVKFAKDAGCQIYNHAGLIGQMGFWKANDYRLIPDEMNLNNPNKMLWLDSGYAEQENRELKQFDDRHSQFHPIENRWITVCRQLRGLNPSLDSNLIYCDYEAVNEGVIRGYVSWGKWGWWIQANRPENPEFVDLVFRLWECVSNWLEIILPQTATRSDEDPPNVCLQLKFEDVENWKVENLSVVQPDKGLTKDLNVNKREVSITFPESFIPQFHRSENYAELEIVKCIIECLTLFEGQKMDSGEVMTIAKTIVRNDDCRFFHLINSDSLEYAVPQGHIVFPNKIPEEVIASVRMGLAFDVKENPDLLISNKEDAVSFLDESVAFLLKRISKLLKNYSLSSITMSAFTHIDQITREAERWQVSTRSLLALESNASWLLERLRIETSKTTSVEITNRVIIEMGTFSYGADARKRIPVEEHVFVLANIAVMIELANSRDAIVNGIAPPQVVVCPNGVIDCDETFLQSVFEPYMRSKSNDKIFQSSEMYKKYYGKLNDDSQINEETSAELEAFAKAFFAEYKFGYEKIFVLIDFFRSHALRSERIFGFISHEELTKILKIELDLDLAQVESFVKNFVLPIRPAWNKELPSGCTTNDVLPWKNWRGFSVLLRPVVEISQNPKCYAISASHLIKWSRYIVNTLSEGYLPPRIFESEEMVGYIGNVANKKGNKFTLQVAEIYKKCGFLTKIEAEMTELGAPPSPNLGDMDVIAWSKNSNRVFLVECKRLKNALNVGQVIKQLEDFKGNMEHGDYLAKHKRRVDWLKENPLKVASLTGKKASSIEWCSLLVSSDRVPMAYMDGVDFKKEQVVPFVELAKFIKE